MGLKAYCKKIFQSTPPARGATAAIGGSRQHIKISIHAPREGGDGIKYFKRKEERISIHAPREGGDWPVWPWGRSAGDFNPRPPRGGRQRYLQLGRDDPPFQSTPPARGATVSGSVTASTWEDFNPRPPRGGRLPVDVMMSLELFGISIHAPREGGDSVSAAVERAITIYFNPRPPRGGRPCL